MASSNALDQLLRTFDTNNSSPNALDGGEFINMLKSFDENGDGNFSKGEFKDLASEFGMSESQANSAYNNLTENGSKSLSVGDVGALAKDEMKDGSVNLSDLGDIRSRLLGLGGSQDSSLGNGAGQGNPGLNTSGLNLGKAVDGFNSLDTDDNNEVSKSELKAGLEQAAKDGKLSKEEFSEFAQEKLGMSEEDANKLYAKVKEASGGEEPSTDTFAALMGGDNGRSQGLGDFLQSISDLR